MKISSLCLAAALSLVAAPAAAVKLASGILQAGPTDLMVCNVVNVGSKPIEPVVQIHDFTTGASLVDPTANFCDDGPIQPNTSCTVQAKIGMWLAGFCTVEVGSAKVRAVLTVVVPGGPTLAVLPLTK
jgi:hypothetical protein